MNNIFQYIGIVLLILLSAFFSASEIAYASVNVQRLRNKAEEKKNISLRLAVKICEDYSRNLGAILIGNNIANTAASSIATVIVVSFLGDDFAWIATLVMTLLILVFGEIIPKVLSKQFSETVTNWFAFPVTFVTLVLRPVNAVVMLIVNLVSKIWSGNETDSEAVSEEDLENIIDIVEDEGVLDEEQCDLLQNALDFDDVLAYEVITPRVDMDAIDIRDPYEVNVKKLSESTYSRIPVYEDTPDKIIGILHLNRFYKELIDNEKVHIRSLLLPVTFVHKTMPLPDVLEKMKSAKSHLVVVLDEYGGTMGILTMEDVLEQLVGEIWDENDEIDEEFVCIDDTHFEAAGDMRIYDFFDEFDMDVEDFEDFEDDNTTVGGWVISMLEGEVKEKDEFTFETLKITVIEGDEKRIDRIAVEEIEIEEDSEEED